MAAALVTYRLQSGKIAEPRVGVGGAEATSAAHRRGRGRARRQGAGRCRLPRRRRSRRQSDRSAGGSSDQRRLPARSGARRGAPRAGALNSMTAHAKGHSDQRLRQQMGRPLDPPAGRSGAGRPGKAASPPISPPTRWVRFVRSPVAAGRIDNIEAPAGALMITAASLKGVKPIRPMLHKFNYKPIGQPILATGRRAFCRRADRRGRGGEHGTRRGLRRCRSRVSIKRDDAAGRCAGRRLNAGAPLVHADVPGNVVVEGRVKIAGVRRRLGGRAQRSSSSRRARAGRTRRRWRRAPDMPPTSRDRPHHADLHHADAASHPHGDRRHSRHAGIRPARHRARRRRRLRAENVAGARIRAAGVAGAQAQNLGRLDRGPAREPDRRLPQPRPDHRAGRRLRHGTRNCWR